MRVDSQLPLIFPGHLVDSGEGKPHEPVRGHSGHRRPDAAALGGTNVSPENKFPGDTFADAMTQMGGVELMLVGLMLALTPKTKFDKSSQFPFDNGLDDGEPDAQPQPAETPIG